MARRPRTQPAPAPSPASLPARTPPVLAPGTASIRMYRQGIGDCFLVRVPRKDGGAPFTLMIDCGAIDRTPDGAEFMNRVVADIVAETGGVVDVMAVTHEHWDHLSGFTQARAQFASPTERGPGRLQARAVWCAWTEDPTDQLALVLKDGLRAARETFGKKVVARHQTMQAAGQGGDAATARLTDLLGFYGVGLDDLAKNPFALAGKGKGKTKTAKEDAGEEEGRSSITGAAFNIAKGVGPNVYRYPGEAPIALEGCEDVRVFILGPPHDPDALAKTDPRSAGYHLAFASRLALGGNPSDDDRAEARQPFDDDVALDDEQRTPDANWAQLKQEMAQDPWRLITLDEAAEAAQFALMLDGATNNTSLVMAIELGTNGPVLLFVGDAQAGNWLSWDAVSWQLPGRTVTAADLLSRTVFYKVGHHGSHNATLKEKGLERMTRPDLVAFVPVDRAVARLKRWGRMPLPSIVEELRRRTGNRTALSERSAPPTTADAPWKPDFGGQLREGPDKLWYEITVPV
jgi:hypothetical protein